MEANILSLLSSSTPVTFNALQKAVGLSATGLALALVDLGGKVAVQDGGLVLAPELEVQATTRVPAGPRGPTAGVALRLEACQALLLQLGRGESGVTAKALLKAYATRALTDDELDRILADLPLHGHPPGCTESPGRGDHPGKP